MTGENDSYEKGVNNVRTAMWTIIFGVLFSAGVAVFMVPLSFFFTTTTCNGFLQDFTTTRNDAALWTVGIIGVILSFIFGFILARKFVLRKYKTPAPPEDKK